MKIKRKSPQDGGGPWKKWSCNWSGPTIAWENPSDHKVMDKLPIVKIHHNRSEVIMAMVPWGIRRRWRIPRPYWKYYDYSAKCIMHCVKSTTTKTWPWLLFLELYKIILPRAQLMWHKNSIYCIFQSMVYKYDIVLRDWYSPRSYLTLMLTNWANVRWPQLYLILTLNAWVIDTHVEDKGMHQRRSARMKQLPKHWDIYQLG